MSLWGTIAAGLNKAADGWINAEVESPLCRVCKVTFSLTVRRHRCRACLEVVCAGCSKENVDLDGDLMKHRVCEECFEKLDASGLIGQMKSVKCPEKSRFKLTLCGLKYGTVNRPRRSSGAGQVENRKSSLMFNFTIGDKLINSLNLSAEKMSLSFEFSADVYSPLESYLFISVFDAGKQAGEELAHCRVILSSTYLPGDSYKQTHSLISKDKSFPVELAACLEVLHRQSRALDARPALRIEVPFAFGKPWTALLFSPGDHMSVEELFPPSSPLYDKLFHYCSLSERRPLPRNELVVDMIDDCWVQKNNSVLARGVLMLSTHRLIFIEYPSAANSEATSNPDSNVESNFTQIEKSQPTSSMFFVPIASTSELVIRRFIQKNYHGLEVVCKDGISHLFRFRREAHNDMTLIDKFRRIKSEMTWRREEDVFGFSVDVRHHCIRQSSDESQIGDQSGMLTARSDKEDDDVFVYVGVDVTPDMSRPRCSTEDNMLSGIVDTTGMNQCSSAESDLRDLMAEYDRLLCKNHSAVSEMMSDTWRVSDVNRHFSVCPSYPPLMIVPTSLSDEHIIRSSKERSAGRLPALTWIHPLNGASITRSSQPMVGINVTACPSDEQLLMRIRECAVSFREQVQSQVDATDDGLNIEIPTSFSPEEMGVPDSPTAMVLDNQNRHLRAISVDDERLIIDPFSSDGVPSSPSMGHHTATGDTEENAHNDSDRVRPVTSSPARVAPLTSIERPISDDALTKLGGLMQGFRGTQSIALRDSEYLREKQNLHKQLDSSGMLSFHRRTKLRVVDCRPLISAKGNVLMGKGHEVIDRLGGAKCTSVEFAGIANIHAVRESYIAMRRACYAASKLGDFAVNSNFMLAIIESKWLQHLSTIIFASVCVAENISNGDPVLVHCSDGWDRTSQVTALAQLLLDPYYRTIKGFQVLLAKDFAWFGHRFRSRSGYDDPGEQSPVFLQFIDCVWQIWRQCPHEFEFNEYLLSVLLYSHISRYTVDYVFDNFRERIEFLYRFNHFVDNHVTGRLDVSIWDYIYSNKDKYLNPLYVSTETDPPLVDQDQALAESNFSTAANVINRKISLDVSKAESEFDSDSDSSSEDKELYKPLLHTPPQNLLHETSSLPELISAAIQSDLRTEFIEEVIDGSFNKRGRIEHSASAPPLTFAAYKGTPDSEFIVQDPIHKTEWNYNEKRRASAVANKHYRENALMGVSWSADRQGGPVASHPCDERDFNCNNKRNGGALQNIRPVKLIRPSCSLHTLALWEAVHMVSGIPFGSSHCGSSSTSDRGLVKVIAAEREKSFLLEQQVKELTALLEAQSLHIRKLEAELFRAKIEPADADTVIVDSSDIDMDNEALHATNTSLSSRTLSFSHPGWVDWGKLARHPAVVATTNALMSAK